MRNASGQGVIYSQMVAERLGGEQQRPRMPRFRRDARSAHRGELAVATGLTTGAITGVIDRLEQAGFARRGRDADDRRKVMVKFQPAPSGASFRCFSRWSAPRWRCWRATATRSWRCCSMS